MIVETGKRMNVLFVSFTELPREVQKTVKGWLGFGNDVILPVSSEFDVESYKEGMKAVEDYRKEMQNRNGFKGDLNQFVQEYGLQFDVWFIRQNFDLTGVDEILVNVCW